MELCFSSIQWVLPKKGHQPFIWLAELDRQVFFDYLEFSSIMFDVDIKQARMCRTYKKMEILGM